MVICRSLADTQKVAEGFAECVRNSSVRCFALYGNLGSGKTTFAQFFIKKLIPSVVGVSSPTFTVVQVYDGATDMGNMREVWHVDCYRLQSPEEFYELGLEEAFQSCITIIEWPEIIEDFLPKDTIKIHFSLIKNGERKIEIS